ncbi:hypothetical protein [Zoogloea sp.]|uniref:Uncharacterized protein n=2 Tax=Zoogloeaceae TaxID=2008794 RepID=A0A5C7SQ34_THASP|nr:hypothetical protein [uncultured Zoogloea sp.]MCK6387395.1 hypothetical protein [Zoogloea sp.]TXH85216.1 MAG: hypothetical protein E6Q80_10065 [Thauera aminoaromatica]
MSQNLVSLALSADQLTEVNKALDMLEKNLEGLISLSADDRAELRKMGPKSEMFARKAHDVLAQAPEILPGTFELADFTADIEALDQLRPVFTRIAALAGRADDTEMALGSDIFTAALEGYRFAKLAGKGTALDELRAQARVRFARQGKRKGAEGSDPA